MVEGARRVGLIGGFDSLDVQYLRGWPGLCGFRLSLESGVALSTSNQTAKTTVYLTPCPWSPTPGIISCYEAVGGWTPYLKGQASASLSGLTANLPYDVFAYISSGTLTLDPVAWSNATTRATALATQDSVLVKTSAANRLYVGTILITGTTGQCEFSYGGSAAGGTAAFFGLWNNFNSVLVEPAVIDSTTSWTYNSATWRAANASNTNRITWVTGVQSQQNSFSVLSVANGGSGSDASQSIGYDSTSAVATKADATYHPVTPITTALASVAVVPSAGTHYAQRIEARINGAAAGTFYGTGTNVGSSFRGRIWC